MGKDKVLFSLTMLIALILCVACSNKEEKTNLLSVESDFIEYVVKTYQITQLMKREIYMFLD